MGMAQAAVRQLDDFIGSVQHLSQHTRAAYRRYLQALQQFCERGCVDQWRQLDGPRLGAFVAQRHRHGIGGRSLQRNLS